MYSKDLNNIMQLITCMDKYDWQSIGLSLDEIIRCMKMKSMGATDAWYDHLIIEHWTTIKETID